MPWFVICTKFKSEFKVAETLENNGFEVYCPSITTERQWSDRKKRVKTPLFNSFVFINIAENSREKVFDFINNSRYLFWLRKPAIVRDSEIEVLKEWMSNDQVDEARVLQISAGDKIIIANGNFKEQEAVVKEIGKQRMKLILPLLGFTINVKIKEIV
ncbi:UpxY family transcription antiterminator [Gillisia sp. CAL575]|uniref:UpxY family transcription antiterminator n=1 Tax=Gillisia sp. CAL575 TaxID=985255 RepID=UPI00054E34FE|nr:UpxY family transcription antiterminator [Gillisia sp. CAL575]